MTFESGIVSGGSGQACRVGNPTFADTDVTVRWAESGPDSEGIARTCKALDLITVCWPSPTSSCSAWDFSARQ